MVIGSNTDASNVLLPKHFVGEASPPRSSLRSNSRSILGITATGKITMIIWIDADACPRPIKQIVYRASERLGIAIRLVANVEMRKPDSPLVSVIKVEAGFDVADKYITQNVSPDDIVITADIPLAADVVLAGAIAIDPRGKIYSKETIGDILPMRNLLMEMRDSGMNMGGPPPFNPNNSRDFAASLDRLLSQRLRSDS